MKREVVRSVEIVDWAASPYSSVDGHEIVIEGPAYADGPVALIPVKGGTRAIALVIDFADDADGIIASALDNKNMVLGSSAALPGEERRLVVKMAKASAIAGVTLRSAKSGRCEVRLASAAAWSLNGKVAPASVFRPSALSADASWAERAYGSGGTDDGSIARWLAWSELRRKAPVRWWGGTRIQLHPGEALSKAIALTGSYEPETAVAIRRLLPRGGVFVDAGANSGVFAIPAARWAGPDGMVIAVEPSMRECAKLRENIALNDLENVVIVEAAIGRETGSARLLLGDDANAGLNTLGPELAHGVVSAGFQAVSVLTLDQIITEAAATRLDLVKADIEGGEFDLIVGGRTVIDKFRPLIIMEIEVTALDAANRDVGELEAWLSGVGYELLSLDAGSLSPRPLDGLAGAEHGNILAVPAERRDEVLLRFADPHTEAANRQLVAQIAAVSQDSLQASAQLLSDSRAATVAETTWLRDELALAREAAREERQQGERDRRELEEKFAEHLARASERMDDAERRAAAQSAALDSVETRLAAAADLATDRGREIQELTNGLADREAELKDARHQVHQLDSRVRQQRSAVDDMATELARTRDEQADADRLAQASRAERDAERDAHDLTRQRLETALDESSHVRTSLEIRNDEVRAATERQAWLETELKKTIASHADELKSVDTRVTATLKAVSRHHRQSLDEMAAGREATEALARSLQEELRASVEAAHDDSRKLRNDANNMRVWLEEANRTLATARQESTAYHERYQAASREVRRLTGLIEERESQADAANAHVFHLADLLADRDRRLAKARARPFRHLAKSLGLGKLHARRQARITTPSDSNGEDR